MTLEYTVSYTSRVRHENSSQLYAGPDSIPRISHVALPATPPGATLTTVSGSGEDSWGKNKLGGGGEGGLDVDTQGEAVVTTTKEYMRVLE